MASNVTPLRKAQARRAVDAEIGIAWWNSMSPRQRLEALRAADTCCPADAWAHWQQNAAAFKCEGAEHG